MAKDGKKDKGKDAIPLTGEKPDRSRNAGGKTRDPGGHKKG